MAAPESSILTSRIPISLREALEVADETWLDARQKNCKNCLGAGPTMADDDHYRKIVKAAFSSALNMVQYGFDSTEDCLTKLNLNSCAYHVTLNAYIQYYNNLPPEMDLDQETFDAISSYVRSIGPVMEVFEKVVSAIGMINALDGQLDKAAFNRQANLFQRIHNMMSDKFRKALDDLKEQQALWLKEREIYQYLGKLSLNLIDGQLAKLEERIHAGSQLLEKGKLVSHLNSTFASKFLFRADDPEACQTIELILSELQPMAEIALKETSDVLKSFEKARHNAEIAGDHARKILQTKTSSANQVRYVRDV